MSTVTKKSNVLQYFFSWFAAIAILTSNAESNTMPLGKKQHSDVPPVPLLYVF